MAKNYSYPRVTMSTLAKKHSHNVVNVPDTTTMFAPLVTEKGPDDRVVKVHTLSEFIEIFGSFNEEFYDLNGQMALNVYNWLSNGGTLMVKRLKSKDAINAFFKYAGNNVTEEYFPGVKVLSGIQIGYDLVLSVNNEAIVISDINDIFYIDEDVNIKLNNPQISGGEYKLEALDDVYYLVPNDFTATEETNWSDYLAVFKVQIVNVSNGISLQARYHGDYYNNIKLVAEEITSHNVDKEKRYYNFYVKHVDSFKNEIILEKFLQKNVKNFAAAISKSEYIKDISNSLKVLFEDNHFNSDFNCEEKKDIGTEDKPRCRYTFALNGGTNSSANYTNTLSLISDFWTHSSNETDSAQILLSNRMETTIDIIFDAGYPKEIKEKITNFVRNDSEESIRPDIIFIADAYSLSDLRLAQPSDDYLYYRDSWSDKSTMPTNIAIYEQYFTIYDSIFTTQDIYVTPSYFLSKLFIYNDLTYGLQYPTAGLRRGLLEDAISLNKNPDPDTKEDWFAQRVNYVEKSAREYAFMSQRTFDGSTDMDYTALSFLNNERVLERMKKDLETIGRSYLHEFNDAVTIANMSNALNKYVSNWISNRTLSMGIVEVVQDEVSENALDINLNIRFTNTIEVINVSIVIE